MSCRAADSADGSGDNPHTRAFRGGRPGGKLGVAVTTPWRISQEGPDKTRVEVEGAISEETDFRPLMGALAPVVVVDLGGVSHINSCGIREWLDFVRQAEAGGTHLVLERCAPLVVAQLNMISNFMGNHGEVRSVLGPYACDDCGHEHLELIALDQSDVEVPDVDSCPKCGAPMEFEELEELYLQFHEHRNGA